VLEEEVLPRLVAERGGSEAGVRVWTAGCATGEESYSIAMALLDQLGVQPGDPRLTVLASDVDGAALAVARAGSYPEAISVTVPPARLARFFEKTGDRYLVRKALREAVLFAPQNLVRDPPFSRCDLIICRNVLIYFEPAQQSRILELFHFALNPGGILFLGKSESLGAQADLFEPVSREHRIFRRVGTAASLVRGFTGRWGGTGGFLTPMAKPANTPGPAELVRAHLGQRSVSAAVLVNRDGRALYFHGETGRYLQPVGEPAWDLPSLAREGLRTRLRAGLRQAVSAYQAETLEAVTERDGRFIRVAVVIEPLEDFAESGLLLVCFDEPSDTAPEPPGEPPPADAVLHALEEELAATRAHLLTAEREAEAATAELRIAHEEAMSMNEELQSSNEELETSKEELQALVEELETVNTELEAKVAELERALNDLRNLMDSTRVAILFLDEELRVRRFTVETARLFHLIDADEGRLLRDITSRVADPDLLAEALAVLKQQESLEKEVRTPEGEWFLRRILPYRTREGRVEGVVVSYTDITSLREAAEEARRLAAVLRDSNDAVIAYDFAGRIFLWSRGAQGIYGYDGEQSRGLDMARLVPEPQHEAQQALVERVRQLGSAGPETLQRIARDGRVLAVSVTASLLSDESGAPYAVISTERDVTEQLRLEKESYFRAMADDIPALLHIDDGKGRTQFVNRAWVQFAGETDNQALLGQGWLRYVHPQDLDGYQDAYRLAQREHRRFDGDLRMRQANGDYHWMRVIAVPRCDEAGRVLHYVNLTLDVEERKRAEQGLVEAAVHKDRFLAMLAHELRNPLAPIGNAASVIASCRPTEPAITWAADVITRQTQQLARLVDDLMDAARVASGKITLFREPVEISVLVEQACESVGPAIDARRQELRVEVPAEPLFVEGDLTRLIQVIGNLLTNASKYTPERGRITLEVAASPGEIVIAVSDNGEGIAPQMLPRVFGMFIQADDTLDRAQGGLGIGLNLVERLVQLHGGSVEARSDGLGHGSEFRVRLPRLELPQHDIDPTSDERSETSGEPLRVLVVDDNVDSAEGLAMLLNLSGNHDARIAHDGVSALSIAAEFRPDVVVLDIGLPGMDGYEVARRLRGRRETARVLLIALTGYGSPEDAQRIQAAGFDHHLVKPAPSERLLALINQNPPAGLADA
jgi:two-component system, chemotaxis family, CheB/CheR fusion protein